MARRTTKPKPQVEPDLVSELLESELVDELRSVIRGASVLILSTVARTSISQLQHVLEKPKAVRQRAPRAYVRRYSKIARALHAQQHELVAMMAARYNLNADYAQRAARMSPLWRPLEESAAVAEREARAFKSGVAASDVERLQRLRELRELGLSFEEIADLCLAIDGVDIGTGRRARRPSVGLLGYVDGPGQWDENDGRGRFSSAIERATERG